MVKFCFFALITLLSVHLALSADPPQISPSLAPKLAATPFPPSPLRSPPPCWLPLQSMRFMARSHPRRRCLPRMRLLPLPRPHPPPLYLNLRVNEGPPPRSLTSFVDTSDHGGGVGAAIRIDRELWQPKTLLLF
ncbi:hypothetical protein CRG98_045003 [Punica granatum]|uniref:Uncharacterized protein n=1 Tax=Punica granatum TaxID=22663 RepID=A0A2I0HSB7_PUNGR|nr:hypothetical protein CRG98_045003 [Punica granatum]